MNTTGYFFWAYLWIEVGRIAVKVTRSVCPEGHEEKGPYCSKCGLPVTARSVEESRPIWHLRDIAGDKELLSDITPPEHFGTGVIIAVDNKSTSSWWGYYRQGYDVEVQVRDFPTDAEVEEMKQRLALSRAEMIALLRSHPAVTSVEVRAGFVLAQEY